jgi:predicted aspartyl protease
MVTIRPLYFAFHSGRQFQNALVDTAFNLLAVDLQGIGDLAFRPADVLHFVQATGQIVLSSIWLASKLVDPLIHQQAKQVLEFGSGMGL